MLKLKFNRKNVAILSLLAAILLLFCSAAWAVRDNKSGSGDKIIAVIPADAPPTYYRDQNTGEPTGFAVDLANEIAGRAGLTISYRFANNWEEIERIIQRGAADIVPGLSISEGRKSIYIFSEPFEVFPISFFVRAASAITDLKEGAAVGVIRGSVANELLQSRQDLKVVLYENFETGLFDLLAGKIDSFSCPAPILWRLARETRVDEQIMVVGKPVAEVKRAFGIRKDRTELAERINKALEGFVGSSAYQDIYTRWYGRPHPFMSLSKQTVWAIVIMSLAIISVGIWRHWSMLGLTRKLQAEIEEREKMREALRVNEERLRLALSSSQQAWFDLDIPTGEIRTSPEYARMLGWEPEEFRTDLQTWIDGIHPDDRDGMLAGFNACLTSGEPCSMEYRRRTKSGEWIWLRSTGKVVAFDAEQHPLRMTGTYTDITARRKTEDELAQATNEQRIILSNLAVGVLFLKNRNIIWANKSLCDMFGYPAEQLLAHTTEMLYPDHETFLSTGEKAYAALARGEIHTVEVPMIRKDRTPMRCKLIGQAVNPARLEDGAIWLIEDVTEHRKMEEALIKARNLESLGVLAGGIAHDFNNLLQGLLGSITVAKSYTPETSEAYPFLTSAELGYNAAINLTNQLIAFSTGGISVRKTIQPAGLIRDVVSFVLSGSAIKEIFELPEDLLCIRADTGQLSQVIGNITLNAKDAMPSGGILMISASNERLASGAIAGLPAGMYVRISFRDVGCGIPADILPKIFDPYFSTRERGLQKGMGLGLTVSDAVIRKHGGVITVESEVGKGSAFHIYMPAVVREDELPKEGRHAAQTGTRILIMDDEPGVYRIAVDFLTLSGYRVDAVTNGDEAISAYRAAQEAGDPYAAVILDLTIPGGMGGQEAFGRLREIDPAVRVIVSSGYANDPVLADYALYGYKGALVKPYPLEVLKQTLARIV